MALKYRKVKREVRLGNDKGQIKTYGEVRAGKKISFDQICKDISEYSTATKGDVMIAISGLETFMVRELANGKITQIGDLGNFRITGGSTGVENKEDFTLHLMKRPRITFTPGSMLRDLCNEAKFTQQNVRTEYVDEKCDRPHLDE